MLNPLIFLGDFALCLLKLSLIHVYVCWSLFLPTVVLLPCSQTPLLNHLHLTPFLEKQIFPTHQVKKGHCKSSCTHSACPCLAHKCNGVLPSTSLCFNKTAFCLGKDAEFGMRRSPKEGWNFRLAGTDGLNFWELPNWQRKHEVSRYGIFYLHFFWLTFMVKCR